MIDPTRRQLLDVLAEISELMPEVRLGQMIAFMADRARWEDPTDSVGRVEDEELLPIALRHLEEAKAVAGQQRDQLSKVG
jgi:hypothetical protein